MKGLTNRIAAISGRFTLEHRIGVLILIGVLLFYLCLIPDFSVPGRWAGIAATFSGLDPLRPPIRPLWSGLTALLAHTPIGNIGYAYNLLTALTGAASCWLLYEIVRRIPFQRTFLRGNEHETERVPRIIAGVASALYGATSYPMLVFSTRGDYTVFDAFLLLLAIYPAALYARYPRKIYLYGSCLAMGLALVEYPTTIIVFPVYLAAWAYFWWRDPRKPETLDYLRAGLLLLSGLVMLLLFSWAYTRSTSGLIRDATHIPQFLLDFIRMHYFELTRSVPQVGWLLVIGMNVVPFFAVLFRQLDEPQDTFSAIGVHAFRLVLAAVAVMILFELPGSPGYVIGQQVMLLAPTLLVAVWSGFLAGYYYLTFAYQPDIRASRRSASSRKKWMGRLFAGLWLFVLMAAGLRHSMLSSTDHLQPIVDFADQAISRLEGRDFILTDGSLDSSLRLAARKAGVQAKLINLQNGESTEYGRYRASLFASAEYEAMAMLGSGSLLRDWLARDPGAVSRIALLASPELVRFPGITTQPSAFFYTLSAQDGATDVNVDPASLLSVWRDWPISDPAGLKESDAGWFQLQFIARWMSRLANDIGCILDDDAMTNAAASAYGQSLRFWPENTSALLNQYEQVRHMNPEKAGEIEQRIREQGEENPAALNPGYMFFVCGKVRNASAMIDWLSVSPGLINASRLSEAAHLVEKNDEQGRLNIARLHLHDANPAESEAIFRSLLETNPANLDALNGLFRISMLKQDAVSAAGYLDHMASLGVAEEQLDLHRASLALANGNLDLARRMYAAIVKKTNAPSEAWMGLLQIAMQEKDIAGEEAAYTALEQHPAYTPGQYILGERAFARDDVLAARAHFERVIMLQPSDETSLMRLLQIAFIQRDTSALKNYSAALLMLRPDDGYAHHMSAYVHIDAGDLSLAEAALRRSLAAREDGMVLNELAYVLSKLDRHEEAEKIARRAVEKSPSNYFAWDTLAGIQQKIGRHKEALESIARAVALDQSKEPSIMLHAAELYAEDGQTDRAREVIAAINPEAPVRNAEEFNRRKRALEAQLK